MRIIKKAYPIIISLSFLIATSCNSNSNTESNKALSIYTVLIIALLFVLYYIQRVKRNRKREKATSSILSFNQKLENILAKLNDPKEKIKALEMAIERIEDNEDYDKNRAWKNGLLVTAHLHLTVIYHNMDNEKKLMEVFERILELNPHHAMTYYNRGTMYSNKGEYSKALEDLDKSIKYDPSYANAYNNRGMIYNRLEQYQKAIDNYSHSLILHNSAIARYNRANAYAKLKKYKEALADYNLYLELDPYNQYGLKEETEQAIDEIMEKL